LYLKWPNIVWECCFPFITFLLCVQNCKHFLCQFLWINIFVWSSYLKSPEINTKG
jgi:hypothetical protein